MLSALASTASHTELRENTRRLQAGASMLLVDAFDRKVTRDQFIACVSAALGLADALGHYDMMHAVKSYAEAEGTVSAADVEITMQELLGKVQQYTRECENFGKLLVQCPNNEDRVQ